MKPWLDDGDIRLYHGEAAAVLQALPAESIQTCITSPPYWGLRDYGTGEWTGGDAECDHRIPGGGPKRGLSSDGYNVKYEVSEKPAGRVCPRCGAERVDDQLGLEATPEEFVTRIVSIFREVRRVLRADGTLWMNLGDSYASDPGKGGSGTFNGRNGRGENYPRGGLGGLKAKDVVGMPWMVARALQAPQYMGRIRAERDRVWLAATIDAEGSICGFHHERGDGDGTRTGIHIQITNSSMALLDEAHRIWPTSRADHNPHGIGHLGRREIRRWIAHNVDDKAILLQELYPYLIAKRQQALLAWNFLEMSRVSKRIGKLPEGREAKARRSWIVHALSALNRGDGIDLPSWIREPPSLFEDGWYLRSDIIWSKPNPMPESVADRPTKAHEYVFLLAKRPRYFYDADAIREAFLPASLHTERVTSGQAKRDALGQMARTTPVGRTCGVHELGRNRRSVWEIATQPFPEAHFATYPQKLVEPCILAGTSERGECSACGAPYQRMVDREAYGRPSHATSYADAHGADGRDHQRAQLRVETVGWSAGCECAAPRQSQTVLDPFIGSGTTALVARNHGRRCIGIDLSTEYLGIAARRLQQLSLLADGVA